jgi:C4-dicarboxylate-specific signal transduction histidine kinase
MKKELEKRVKEITTDLKQGLKFIQSEIDRRKENEKSITVSSKS